MSRAAIITAAIALAGCASAPPVQPVPAPTCSAGADCNAKWDAAQLWIAKNAGFKLQTATGVLLQTFGPSSATRDSTSLAVTVMREPDGPGQFRIVARMSCGNPFGCTPEAPAALADFNRKIAAATP